jgi:hypothetical protein
MQEGIQYQVDENGRNDAKRINTTEQDASPEKPFIADKKG